MKYGPYVPILKWKRGEQVALQRLATATKQRVCPLLEVVPVAWDYAAEAPTKSIDEHLAGFGSTVASNWGNDRALFIDARLLDSAERMASGAHPLIHVLEDCRAQSVRALPVLSSDCDSDYQTAVMRSVGIDGLGACLRLIEEDFGDPQSVLNSLTTRIGLAPEQCDLVIDLGHIDPSAPTRAAVLTTCIVNSIANISSWRTLTVCASAFPSSMSEVSRGTEEVPRTEWQAWMQVISGGSRISRLPGFGDYAIAHPEMVEIDPRMMKMSANLRYTGENSWVIVKGRAIKTYGAGQMHDLCAALVAHPSYCGASYSYGDGWISECANRSTGPGNAETWRRVGTNHHITLVVDLLANLP